MALISKDVVLHDVAEAYIELTRDEEEVTYGNIAEKIAGIQTGGGGYSNFTVTAIVPSEIIIDASATELVVHE